MVSRSKLLALIVSCLIIVGPSMAAPPKEDRKAVHVTYLYSRTGVGMEGGTSKLLHSWHTAYGNRHEYPDGDVFLYRLRDRAIFALKPGEKIATRMTFGSGSTTMKPSDAEKHLVKAKRQAESVRVEPITKEQLLGYECEATEYAYELQAGRRIRIVKWTASIGGHSIELKSVEESSEGGNVVDVTFREAIRVVLPETAPTHLLEIPADYKIVDPGKDALKNLKNELKKSGLEPTSPK